MIVIPAIDLLDGRVVRLQKGNYNDVTVYSEEPVEEALLFQKAGFDHIHVVDLNGARDGHFVNLESLRQILGQTDLSIQSGGGIRSHRDGVRLLDAGIRQVICSSMAVHSPDEWLRLIEEYPDRVILGMDLKNGKISYGGWKETADRSISEFLEPMIERGLRYVLSTDISRDGMLSGPNLKLYRMLREKFPELHFIASGGVSGKKDLEALQTMDLYGAVVGRAYYEEVLTLEEMQQIHSGNR